MLTLYGRNYYLETGMRPGHLSSVSVELKKIIIGTLVTKRTKASAGEGRHRLHTNIQKSDR